MRLIVRHTMTVASAVVLSVVLGSAVAAGTGSLSVRTPGPAGGIDPGWGWAVVRHPGLQHYTLASADGADSAGKHPTYHRDGLGESVVTFPGVSNGFDGVPVVTALSSQGRACTVTDWQSVGAVRVFVRCFRADGALADTPFATNMVLHGDASSNLAYVYASCSGSGCSIGVSYDPSPTVVAVQRMATGSYEVTLPGMATGTGNVQVSAQAGSPLACRVTGLGSSAGARVVDVACRDGLGAPTDSGFLLVYVRGRGITGVTGRKAASLLATRPGAGSYHPRAGLWFSSAGSVPTIRRSGQGTYLVTLPGMPGGGSAEVTPYGSGQAQCALTSLPASGMPQHIGVRCNKPDGTAADSGFSLTYTH